MAKKKSVKKTQKVSKKAPAKIQRKSKKSLGLKKQTWLFIDLLLIAVFVYGLAHAMMLSLFEGLSIMGLSLVVWLIIKTIVYLTK